MRWADLSSIERPEKDTNARDEYGNTPLHRAIKDGKEILALMLLEKGADIEAIDGCGDTLLHRAIKDGKIDQNLKFPGVAASMIPSLPGGALLHA
jgi:hypothetical protein